MNEADIEHDEEIEERIEMKIIVDAYGEQERAMGWYYYMADNLTFPFKAKCIKVVSTSPLSVDEVVEVLGMDDAENCENDMFVKIKWRSKEFCAPIKQLEGINVDDETWQVLNDWSYWIAQGYCF